MKVLLISVDGMRPDSLSGAPAVKAVMDRAAYSLNASSVMPCVTLPCHMTMFHSVDPGRHGITTNTYVPQVRPIRGLCEVLKAAKKTSAMFYNWEELRDLARPGSVVYSYFTQGRNEDGKPAIAATWREANDDVTDVAIRYLTAKGPDFAFLYMGFLDEAGHKYGWLSPQYYDALENSFRNIQRVLDAVGDEYTVLITADHGGHERNHGMDVPEDMTIPMLAIGQGFMPGAQLPDPNLQDLAPTVCAILGVEPDEDWEGASFYR